MKRTFTFILFLFSFNLHAQISWMIVDSIRHLAFEDKQMRQQVDSAFKKYGKDSPQWKSAWTSLQNSDREHNAFIKDLITGFKVYPGKNYVGEDASHCFWTLVLHQDKDTALQKEVIALMKPEVDQKNVEPNEYAYLVDRLKLNTGKNQIYGTQCYYDPKKKAYVPRPIDDRENVDKRRKEMELPPMSEYLKMLNDTTLIKFH